MALKSKPNEIAITRLYDAPVKLVWDAWTDPKQAALWWGPRGFTITTHSKDLRVGGTWDYTMHGPDGTDYPNTTVYHEVEKYSRLVYDHGGSKDRPPLFRVTVQFTEVKGKTLMEMIMALSTAEEAEKTKKFIKQASGNSTWDRLAEYLDKQSTGQEKFVINRSFETSVETMFEMWTNPEHFAQWLAPTGFSMKFLKANIQVGQNTFYCMTNNKDIEMYGQTHYLEILRPNKLVYTQDFRTKEGEISRHPGAPTWPETMMTTVLFAEEGPNQTRVTITWEPHGKTSTEELQAFIKERSGMTQGWTGSFDKLEEYLLSRSKS